MLRETTPWHEDSDCAWGLAAAWINRSDAMRRLGDPLLMPEAIRSLDRCIEAMGRVRLAERPEFVERLILAWINRATACGEIRDATGALESFMQVEAVFSAWGEDATPSRCFLLAMLHTNRALVRLDAGEPALAWQDARQGIEALKALEPGDALVSQAGIRARGALCRTLAECLDMRHAPSPLDDWIAQATDAVEEALSIMKRSGLAEPAAADLVRYGARIYRLCQPQFLAAFVREWLATDSPLATNQELATEMAGVLQLARVEAEARLLTAPHDDAVVARELRILKALE